MPGRVQPYNYQYRGQYPRELKGEKNQRVFVGGHYDFMPTLRHVADCVSETRRDDGSRFISVIPYFHKIDQHKVMDEDRQMVSECGRAIFEVSDLGGQLIEMEEALRIGLRTLLVYAVREDEALEPERGRLTITTCGHPFTSYVTTGELREKIRSFLLELKEPPGYIIRFIESKAAEAEIQQLHELIRDENHREAMDAIDQFVRAEPTDGLVDAYLAQALVESRTGDIKKVTRAFRRAKAACRNSADESELAYYRGLIERERDEWAKAKKQLRLASRLQPEDPRILVQLGYVHERSGGASNLKKAIDYERLALQAAKRRSRPTRHIQWKNAVSTEVQARNNLAYYLYLQCKTETSLAKKERVAEEILTLTQEFPLHHRRLGQRKSWLLDTRACALLLSAELHGSMAMLDEAKTLLNHARSIASSPAIEENWRKALDLTAKLEAARAQRMRST